MPVLLQQEIVRQSANCTGGRDTGIGLSIDCLMASRVAQSQCYRQDTAVGCLFFSNNSCLIFIRTMVDFLQLLSLSRFSFMTSNDENYNHLNTKALIIRHFLTLKLNLLALFRKMRAPIIVTLLTLYTLSAPVTQSLVQLNSTVQFENSQPPCSFYLAMGSKKAVYELSCNQGNYTDKLNVSEHIIKELHDTHVFVLTGPNGENGQIFTRIKYGLEWVYNVTVRVPGGGLATIEGSKETYEYSIVYLTLIYSILGLLVLPPFSLYYLHMQGLSIFSALTSIILSISVNSNITVILCRYVSQVKDLPQTQPIVMTLVLMACLTISFLHLYHKAKTYWTALSIKYHNQALAKIVMGLSLIISIIGLVVYLKIHKDVTTYIGFAIGLIYYMVGFLVCAEMRKKRVFFSFRLVLFDGLSIMLLALCSKFYPILNYQILNFYSTIAALLIVVVLIVYGGITFILVNIIKRDSQLQSQAESIQQSLHQMQEKHSNKEMVLQTTAQKKENWRNIKQESMMSEMENNSGLMKQQN